MSEPTEQIDSVGSFTNAYIFKNYLGYVTFYVAISAGVFFAISHLNLDSRFVGVPIILGIAGYTYVRSKIKSEFTRQFGESIGFSFSSTADFSSVNGQLFSVGNSRRIYDCLSGTFHGMPVRIYSYTFTTGSGKEKRSYNTTVFETTLDKVVPSIILTSRNMWNKLNLAPPIFFGEGEYVNLEGDFNKYFSLKVPRGYEIEAYQIFTPDVMVELIDRAAKLNFEFNASKLYVYASKLVTVRKDLQVMFDVAGYLTNIFNKNARGVSIPTTTTT